MIFVNDKEVKRSTMLHKFKNQVFNIKIKESFYEYTSLRITLWNGISKTFHFQKRQKVIDIKNELSTLLNVSATKITIKEGDTVQKNDTNLAVFPTNSILSLSADFSPTYKYKFSVNLPDHQTSQNELQFQQNDSILTIKKNVAAQYDTSVEMVSLRFLGLDLEMNDKKLKDLKFPDLIVFDVIVNKIIPIFTFEGDIKLKPTRFELTSTVKDVKDHILASISCKSKASDVLIPVSDETELSKISPRSIKFKLAIPFQLKIGIEVRTIECSTTVKVQDIISDLKDLPKDAKMKVGAKELNPNTNISEQNPKTIIDILVPLKVDYNGQKQAFYFAPDSKIGYVREYLNKQLKINCEIRINNTVLFDTMSIQYIKSESILKVKTKEINPQKQLASLRVSSKDFTQQEFLRQGKNNQMFIYTQNKPRKSYFGVNYDTDDTESFMRELDFLFKLDHPSFMKISLFIPYSTIFFEPAATKLEEELNKNMSGTDKAICIFQIASGLLYIHSLGLAFGSFDVNNVYKEKDHFLLFDFGESRFKEIKSTKDDLKSFGRLMYYILTKKNEPFNLSLVNPVSASIIESCMSGKDFSFIEVVDQLKANRFAVCERVDEKKIRQYVTELKQKEPMIPIIKMKELFPLASVNEIKYSLFVCNNDIFESTSHLRNIYCDDEKKAEVDNELIRKIPARDMKEIEEAIAFPVSKSEIARVFMMMNGNKAQTIESFNVK